MDAHLIIQRRKIRGNLQSHDALCTYVENGTRRLLTYNRYREMLSLIGQFLGLSPYSVSPDVARITAASIASRAGMTSKELKLIGSWLTDKSVDTYVRLKVKDVAKAQTKLVKHLKLGSSV